MEEEKKGRKVKQHEKGTEKQNEKKVCKFVCKYDMKDVEQDGKMSR